MMMRYILFQIIIKEVKGIPLVQLMEFKLMLIALAVLYRIGIINGAIIAF